MTTRCHLPPIRRARSPKQNSTRAAKTVEEMGPLRAGSAVSWCSLCEKQCGSSAKMLQRDSHATRQFHAWVCTQKNWKQNLKAT